MDSPSGLGLFALPLAVLAKKSGRREGRDGSNANGFAGT
jgi:hypothetical protein